MAKNKFKYFVLLANMRTGSNLFEQNINLFDSFSCNGELFNANFIGFPNQEEFCGMTVTERDVDPNKLIRKMVAQSGDELPGFRLFSDHDHRVLDYVLNDPTCAKIILSRNPLDSFVSHAIARQTDQWKLTDLHKRKTAKVDFDIVGFKSYINSLSKYSKTIRTNLQTSGQSAFYITYDDLNKLDVINGIATYLDSDEQLETLKEKIKRQNPEGLVEKVNNYTEMMEQVRSINFLDEGIPRFHEPERHAAAKNFVFTDGLGLLFQPIGSCGKSAILNWMSAHLSGENTLRTDQNQKAIFNWLEATQSRLAFTYAAHPVERVFEAFERHIIQTGETGFPWVRKILTEQYNVKLPDADLCETANRGVLDSIGFDVEDYRQALKKFAKFLNGNLKGQTRARIDQSWASQSAILGGYSKVVHPDFILRSGNCNVVLQLMEQQLGLENVQIGSLQSNDFNFDLAEIYDEELEHLVSKAYGRDYTSFGFGTWQA